MRSRTARWINVEPMVAASRPMVWRRRCSICVIDRAGSLREQQVTNLVGQQTLLVHPLDGPVAVHKHRAEVRGCSEVHAGIGELFGLFSQHPGSVFGDQTQQLICPAGVRVLHDNNASAQALAGWMAQGESGQIHCWHRAASIIKEAGYTYGSLRELLERDQRQHLHYAVRSQRVAVFTQLEQQKQHGWLTASFSII